MMKRFTQAICFLLGRPLHLDVEGREWIFDPRQRLLGCPSEPRLVRGAHLLDTDTGEEIADWVPEHAKEIGQLMAWAEDRVYSWWRGMYNHSTVVEQFVKKQMGAEVRSHDGRYFVSLQTWNPMAMEHDRVCEFDQGDVRDMIDVLTRAAQRIEALKKP